MRKIALPIKEVILQTFRDEHYSPHHDIKGYDFFRCFVDTVEVHIRPETKNMLE